MVRLPASIFVAIDRDYFAAEGLDVTPAFSENDVAPGLVKTVPDLRAAVDDSFVAAAR